MPINFARILTAFSLVLASSACSWAYVPSQYQSDYDEGYQFGFDRGHEVGWGRGYDSGVTEGATAGEEAGYDAGWEAAYQPAFDAVYGGAYEIGAAEGYVVSFAAGFLEGFKEGEAYTQYLNRSSGLFLSNAGYGLNLSNFIISGNPTWSGAGGSEGGLLGATLTIVYTDVDYSQHWYDKGNVDGYNAGLELGETDGYDAAYQPAYDIAFEAAFIDGGIEGAEQGELEGLEIGYGDGWASMADTGEENGFAFGFAYQQAGGSLDDFGLTAQQIAALESYSNSLTSVPEPSAGLLVIGLIVCRGVGRKKRC